MYLRVGPPRIGENRLTRVPNIAKAYRVSVCFGCFATLLTAACSKQIEAPPIVAIEHEISPQPLRVGLATVVLSLTDAAGKPVTGADITVEADMTHPGMSPVLAQARETAPGRYQAPVEFQMAGDWVILLHLTLLDGKKLESQFDLRGVRPK